MVAKEKKTDPGPTDGPAYVDELKPTIQELVDKRRELVAQLSEIDTQISARHGEPRDDEQ